MAVVLKTISDSKDAQADLAKLKDSVNSIQSSVEKVTSSFQNFTRAITIGITALTSGSLLTRYSDELIDLDNRLKLATDSQEEFNASLKQIRRIALETRTPLNDITKLYTKIASSTKEIGASQSDIVKVADTISKAISVSGSSLVEANAAILQFSQGLASGRLAGDELRSVLENAPALAKALAKGLNVSVGELRSLGEEGVLTTDKIFQAILSQRDTINKAFTSTRITYGKAITNLGNSLFILFSEVKTTFFDSTSSFADFINNLALGIADFADNLKLNLARAKANILIFVSESVLAFKALSNTVIETSSKFKVFAQSTYIAWEPTINKLKTSFITWSLVAIGAIKQVSDYFVNIFKNSELVNNFITAFKESFSKFSVYVKDIFNKISSNLPKIDVQKFFPNLNQALDTVKTWAKQVEGWFFWLYDKVVGRSWIPDLIKDITDWVSKLLKNPLTTIKLFVLNANKTFASIGLSNIFAQGIKSLLSFKSVLLSVLGVASAIAAAVGGFVFYKSRNPQIDIVSGGTEQVTKYFEESINWLENVYNRIKDAIASNSVINSIKGAFSKKKPEDLLPEISVGQGIINSIKQNDLVMKFSNALKSAWNITSVTIISVISAAFLAVFTSGAFRNVLLAAIAGVWTAVIIRSIGGGTVAAAFGEVANTFVRIIKTGLDTAFDGLAIGDPLNVAKLLAGLALVFKAGREGLLKAAINVAKAPTTGILALGTLADRALVRKQVARVNQEIANLPRVLRSSFVNARTEYQAAIRQITNTADASGRLITLRSAAAAVRDRDFTRFGTDESENRLRNLARTQGALRDSQTQLRNEATIRRNLEDRRRENLLDLAQISKRIRDSSEAFVQGIKSVGAGTGGVLGGLTGFQIGAEIAKNLTDAPGWAKAGIAIAGGFLGQGIGAAIGLAITQALIGSATAVGKAIGAAFAFAFARLTPVGRLITGIAAAFAGGYVLLKGLGTEWRQALQVLIDKYIFPNARVQQTDIPRVRDNISQIEDALNEVSSKILANQPELKELRARPNEFPLSLRDLEKEQNELLARRAKLLEALAKNWDAILGSDNLNTLKLIGSRLSAGDLFELERALRARQLEAKPGKTTVTPPTIETGSDDAIRTAILGALDKILRSSFEVTPEKSFSLSTETQESIKSWVSRFLTNVQDFVRSSLNAVPAEALTPFSRTPVERKATGGFISGPGNGTSDSIPALLSNGEFVVNARDARKNRDILLAINSGLKPLGFKDGTGTISLPGVNSNLNLNRAVPVELGSDESLSLTEKTIKAIKGIFNSEFFANISKSLEDSVFGGAQATPKPDISTVAAQVKAAKDLKTSAGILTKSLSEVGFKSADLSGIENLQASTVIRISEVVDEIKKLETLAANPELPQILARRDKQAADELRAQLARILSEANISADVPSQFRTGGGEELTLADQFKTITDAFPQLGFTIEEFRGVTDNVRESLFASARKVLRETEQLNKTKIELDEKGEIKPLEVATQLAKLETLRLQQLNIARDLLKSIRTPFENLKVSLQEAGLSISEEGFNALNQSERALFKSFVDNARSAMKDIKRNQGETLYPLDAEIRNGSQNYFNEIQEKVQKLVSEALLRNASNFERVKTELSAVGVSLDKFTFNLLTDIERSTLQEYIKQIKAFGDISGADENVRIASQEAINAIIERIRKVIDKTTKSPEKERAELAAEAFASSIAESVIGSTSDLLKGRKTPKEFFKSILDSFTSGVIDTFVKGLMDPFVGKDGIFSNVFKDIGQSLFQNAFGGGSALASSLGSWFPSIFGGGGSAAAALPGVVMGGPAFAEGGFVRGPGNSTSDSILARLSNGEYVINAKDAARNMQLLTAINEGKLRKFADGGLVSTSIASVPNFDSQMTPKSNNNNQIVNINITGDISRQTRAHIIEMLPTITSGVNSRNREKGFKG